MPEFKAGSELVIQYSIVIQRFIGIVKILVFEYITGGGFNKHALPEALVSEGRLMLNALLDNLTRLESLEVTLMLDERLDDLAGKPGINTLIIRQEHDVIEEFSRLVKRADLVWPIAPEFDDILQTLCQVVVSLGKILLTSPALAVAIAGNKFKTYQLLNRHRIAAVATQMLVEGICPEPGEEWMVKPVAGAGCVDSYLITTRQDFEQLPTDTDTDTDTNNFDIHVDEFMINRITNHLVRSEISYKQLVTSLCFIEHDEFSGNDTLINNSDYIFGKIRQVMNAIQPPP